MKSLYTINEIFTSGYNLGLVCFNLNLDNLFISILTYKGCFTWVILLRIILVSILVVIPSINLNTVYDSLKQLLRDNPNVNRMRIIKFK